jgi:GntR family transcriptional regulator
MPTTPLYQRIAAELRQAVFNGQLPPGSQLPTEQELGERYSVSRNTVRLALGQLANEGIITSTPGRGTFVRDRAMLTYHAVRAEAANRPSDWATDAYYTEVRQEGREPSQTFDMRVVPASLSVAHRLRVGEGEAVLIRRMSRFVDGQPWSIQDSSYPMDIAQECGLLVPHDIPRGTVRAMADHGHVEVGYVDEVTTRMPTPDETRMLELGAGVPVLIYVRTAYTKERPVRLTETTFAGDRNRLLYELGELEALYEEGPR